LGQNNSQKGFAGKKKRKTLLIFVKIVQNQTPLGYYYKYMIQGVLCTPNPLLLKFWKIKFETAKPNF
jgi:hypothetical protein